MSRTFRQLFVRDLPRASSAKRLTSRALHTAVQNALDFLMEAELALYPNPVSLTPTSVGWHAHSAGTGFLVSFGYSTVDQYLDWVRAGAYSVLLRDASLLQMSYSTSGNVVVGHRLAYVPCPVQ